MAKKGTKVVAKKKQWVQLVAPKLFNEQIIGESYVADPRQTVGRRITINLQSLVKTNRRQSISASFEVIGLRDGKAMTALTSYRVNPSTVKRMLRRNRDKVADSFACYTSDKVKIRVKPLLVTRSKAPRSVLSKIRKRLRDIISRHAAQATYDQMMDDVVQSKLQRLMYAAAKRIHPVHICEIRWIHRAAGEKVPRLETKESPKEAPKVEAQEKKEEVKEAPKKEPKEAPKVGAQEKKEEVKEAPKKKAEPKAEKKETKE